MVDPLFFIFISHPFPFSGRIPLIENALTRGGTMLKNKGFWYLLMAGALAGWVFSIVGLVRPYKNETIKKVWKNVFFTWAFGHPLEILIARSIGKSAGLTSVKTAIKTILFGFTWWLPVKLGVFKR